MTESLAATDWGWSAVVALVETREEAVATIQLLAGMRHIITSPMSMWESDKLRDLTAAEWQELCSLDYDGDKGLAIMRGLKPIALHPVRRAEALLSLDVHITYLRSYYGLPEPTA